MLLKTFHNRMHLWIQVYFLFCRFDNIPVEVTGNNPPAAIQTFDELLLPDTLKSNLGKAEFTKPTPVQKHGMPIILSGRDIMACAQTGSGKTVS
jgi:superfamily II DNA/RNA helicase